MLSQLEFAVQGVLLKLRRILQELRLLLPKLLAFVDTFEEVSQSFLFLELGFKLSKKLSVHFLCLDGFVLFFVDQGVEQSFKLEF
jgi:hypothetical protein